MTERLRLELERIKVEYGDVEVAPDGAWFKVVNWKLSPGWNKESIALLVQIPPGYPVTPPDNFYTNNDLYLVNGGEPSNSTRDFSLAGHSWRQFSYHVEAGDWQPHPDVLKGHNLLTFLQGAAKRLLEVN